MQKTILSQSQIKKLLEKPANSNTLAIARDNQKRLEQHYSGSHPQYIFDIVQKLLTAQKYARFKQVFKNHSQTLVNKVERHYSRIFDAHGKFSFIDFQSRPDITQYFIGQTSVIFDGSSDEAYFKGNGVRNAMIEPNSLYIVGSSMDENNQLIVNAKHISLCDIHDVSANGTGVRYCIIRHGAENSDAAKYFVYDDANWSVWIKSSGFILDPVFGLDLIPHGNTVCPAVFAFNDIQRVGDHILKKSILWDSEKDLTEYSILRTFYSYYKYFSAFGRDIKPQTRCNYQNKNDNVACNGYGVLQAIDTAEVFKSSGECPNCAGKNKDVWGEQIEIPINQQSNEILINNYSKLNFRIEADTNILKFHSEDVDDLKAEIINDVIGEGYGESYKKQAVNSDQIRSNFDDQESNLNHFKKSIETAWEFILNRAAEIIAPNTERIIKKKLGDKYFLKSVDQLYQELEQLYKGTSNSSLIEQKQVEILLTENKNDITSLQKFSIIKAIKPYSTFPLPYIQQNRAFLNSHQIALYENFDQIMAIYEGRYGNLETIIIDESNTAVVIKNLFAIFNTILNEIIKEDETGTTEREEDEED